MTLSMTLEAVLMRCTSLLGIVDQLISLQDKPTLLPGFDGASLLMQPSFPHFLLWPSRNGGCGGMKLTRHRYLGNKTFAEVEFFPPSEETVSISL